MIFISPRYDEDHGIPFHSRRALTISRRDILEESAGFVPLPPPLYI